MPQLLLQKPFELSSYRQRVKFLERRLDAWVAGQFHDLLMECWTLQAHLRHHRHITCGCSGDEVSQRSHTFACLMLQSKLKAALRLLNNNSQGRVLDFEDTVQSSSSGRTIWEVLRDNHPSGQLADPDALVTAEPSPLHRVIFERITGWTMGSAALHCQGAAGPSGLDAASWKQIKVFTRLLSSGSAPPGLSSAPLG